MRDSSRSMPFLPAARVVFDLTLQGLLRGGRSAVLAVLVGMPLVFALLYRLAALSGHPPVSGVGLYGLVFALYSTRNVLPLAALLSAGTLVADEVEGQTLTYLLTRPIPRTSILAGKYAGHLVAVLALALPTTLLSFVIFGGPSALLSQPAALLRDLGVTALVLAVYTALFTLMATLLRRPMLPGLLFLFGWEFLANFPGDLPRLTITGWVRALVPYRVPEQDFGLLAQLLSPTPLGTTAALVVLPTVAAVCLALAALGFSRREFILSQSSSSS